MGISGIFLRDPETALSSGIALSESGFTDLCNFAISGLVSSSFVQTQASAGRVGHEVEPLS